jgi:hypothetical protein
MSAMRNLAASAVALAAIISGADAVTANAATGSVSVTRQPINSPNDAALAMINGCSQRGYRHYSLSSIIPRPGGGYYLSYICWNR